MIERVTIFVMDSVGIGGLPDAEKFGDIGVNTLGNIVKKLGIDLPNLESLGMGDIDGIDYLKKVENPKGSFGRSAEVSNGKDTTTGHWEMAGLSISEPFQTYPDGFPDHIINKFEAETGRKVLANIPASGTEIIEEHGKEHMETGAVIVYTSADSVFQIAAHEEIVPLEELYSMCQIARDMLMGEDQVARVIARPFLGKPGSFERTSNRKDFSLSPFGETVLDIVKDSGLEVMAVGKIEDIFNGVGVTKAIHTKDNMDGVDSTIKYLESDDKGLIFTNLVDFDAKYGHRRNVEGYKNALEELDARIPEILGAMKDYDVIIFTADHGNDPTYKGSDHTREYIPLVVYGKDIKAGENIGTRKSFSDIAATVADMLNLKKPANGESFKDLVLK